MQTNPNINPAGPEGPYSADYCVAARDCCDMLAAKAETDAERLRWQDNAAQWQERHDCALARRESGV